MRVCVLVYQRLYECRSGRVVLVHRCLGAVCPACVHTHEMFVFSTAAQHRPYADHAACRSRHNAISCGQVVAEWEDAPLALIWPDSVVEHQERRLAATSAKVPIDPRLAALAATAKADRAVAAFRRTPGTDNKLVPCKWASPRPLVPKGRVCFSPFQEAGHAPDARCAARPRLRHIAFRVGARATDAGSCWAGAC